MSHQIRVRHRRQWVISHRRFAEQLPVNKMVAEVCSATVDRECGKRNGEFFTQLVQRCVYRRADVACGGRIEGAAVLDLKLPRPLNLEQLDCPACSLTCRGRYNIS